LHPGAGDRPLARSRAQNTRKRPAGYKRPTRDPGGVCD
jgi:hypothetical protein